MKVSQSFLLPFSWQRIAEVLCDPQFNIERDKLREGVIASEFHEIDEGERHKQFELHTTEYKRTMTGGLNRNGTVRTVTEFRYDADPRIVRWKYVGEAGKLMELSGTYTLQPQDGGTRLVHEVSIFVWLPVIGYYIMKFIAEELEKPSQDYRELIFEHAAGATPQVG
ncbi:MAG: DUF2505 family protein [Gammaproteobacteria bacterium]